MKTNNEEVTNTVRLPYQPVGATDKICPFQSTPDQSVVCSSRCKIYRADKTDYECPIQELNAISFNTRGLRPR
jgi:hypothetical protein